MNVAVLVVKLFKSSRIKFHFFASLFECDNLNTLLATLTIFLFCSYDAQVQVNSKYIEKK